MIFLTRSKRGIFAFNILGLSLLFAACGGGGGGSNLAASTPPVFARYAFVDNSSDDSVSSYMVDADTGCLRYIGKAAGTTPRAVAISGQYAYAINQCDTTVSQYALGNDGSLSSTTQATEVAGTNPYAVTIDPSGQYTYVANYSSNNVSQYTINANSSLSPMSTLTVAAAGVPISLTTTGSWQ